MLNLILAVLLGALFAYFALQNSGAAEVNLAGYIFLVPLYTVILSALLVGIIISGLLSFFSWASGTIAISSKNAQLQKANQMIADLKSRLQQIELEMTKLKGESSAAINEAKIKEEVAHQEAHVENRPHIHTSGFAAFLDRLRYRLAV